MIDARRRGAGLGGFGLGSAWRGKAGIGFDDFAMRWGWAWRGEAVRGAAWSGVV